MKHLFNCLLAVSISCVGCIYWDEMPLGAILMGFGGSVVADWITTFLDAFLERCKQHDTLR